MTRSKALLLLIAAAGMLTGCTRPTQQESTYRLNWQNRFSWQGPGPDIRWYWPWYTTYTVSHQQVIQNFPLAQKEDNAGMAQIELEKLQSIITADSQIMIQEMSITVYQKADPTAIERFYVQHQEEDRQNLAINLDGLVRTYLQTKTKAYIESHQPQLGEEVKNYIKNFRAGGDPIMDSEGHITGFKGGISLEEEWGVDIADVTPRRLTLPSTVAGAQVEAQQIIKAAQTQYDSAQNEADRRESKLRSMQQLSAAVGNNNDAANYLTSQILNDLLEQTPSKNVGRITVLNGLSGSDQAIVSRQSVLQGK
jgi:regulator of protease activity HflC (stomatin/prohibitin superfamily)